MDTFRCRKVQDSESSSMRMSSTNIRSSVSFSTCSQKTGIVARLCNPLHPWISKRLTPIALEKINPRVFPDHDYLSHSSYTEKGHLLWREHKHCYVSLDCRKGIDTISPPQRHLSRMERTIV